MTEDFNKVISPHEIQDFQQEAVDSEKKLVNAINELLGKGSYSRLQKTPYVGNADN